MGQRVSRSKKAERGGECVDGVNPRTTLTATDHTAELHPRPDETPVGTGEGGGQERKEKGGDNPPKLRVSRLRRVRRTRALMGPHPGAVLMDVTCSVEDNDHQEAPFSAPEVPPTAEDQQMEDVLPQDQDSPVSPSADDSPSHLLRHLDCDKITRNEVLQVAVKAIENALPSTYTALPSKSLEMP
ncbi:Aspartyl/glutamyl-tRNA(Asn/Gln) amidotransferase subunit B [Labeo rohita]|uniref:Aspartyl/glutamyl-tRNA(Asn/Gln) amidotransferase subunit B n=1 Tax=Labeo rohita TaxID=84645 RepID=A0ABQ8M2Q6_LABRO|nr:Aspartyl/glutamyl-tRNA(Asn/Gln) amidotransferase subunit B [Labeo rohita]